MSLIKDKTAILEAIVGDGLGFDYIDVGRDTCVLPPLVTLTAFCILYLRKVGQEYRIDYDSCLTYLENNQRGKEALSSKIKDGDFIWKHNIYPEGFTPFTITENKLPKKELVGRIRNFCIENSADEKEVVPFLRRGGTDFLNDVTRFRSEDFRRKILGKVGL